MKAIRFYLKTIVVSLPKLAAALSKTKRAAFKNLIYLYLFLFVKKITKNKSTFLFNFNYRKRDFSLPLENPTDVFSLIEIYVDKEYDQVLSDDVKSILDLGAHWGDTSVYFAIKYPHAKIYAVEPNPVVFQRLAQISVQFSNIVPIQAAYTSQPQDVDFYISKSSLSSSLKQRSDFEEKVIVSGVNLEDLMKLHNVTFNVIKFDIEGGEEMLLKDSQLKSARFLIGEIHYDLISLSKEDVYAHLKGFELTKRTLNKKREIVYAKKLEV